MVSVSDEIRKLMIDCKVNNKTLAKMCGWTSSNFWNKLNRDHWKSEDLQKVVNALKKEIVIKYTPQNQDSI